MCIGAGQGERNGRKKNTSVYEKRRKRQANETKHVIAVIGGRQGKGAPVYTNQRERQVNEGEREREREPGMTR